MDYAASWIDVPVVQAIDYFSGVMATFYNWGAHYAYGIGVIGLSWSAFKLLNSRFTIRDFWWDTLYKWLMFMLLMSLYPMLTVAMSVVGNRIGLDAGKGKKAIIDALSSMKTSIEYDCSQGKKLESELNSELSGITSRSETITFDTSFGNSDNWEAFIDKYYDEVDAAVFNSKSAKKKALEKIDEYRRKNSFHSLYSKKTLKAIKDILVEKKPDGTDGDSLVSEYVDLNIWLKNSKGNDTYYLSPGAIMRVTVLGCQILWEKNELAYAINLNEIDEEDVNFMKKSLRKMSVTFSQLPTMLMTMFCCIVLVFSGIFACIQYVMTILEYTIIVGIGAFFIPFILFDGTKELPKKLIPVFTGFIIKMIVINICLFFVFYLFIQETVEIMSDNGGMNWVTFVTILFDCVIAFVLTQNAPKIAQTILTGQPQLSMGELVTAAGTLAMGTAKGFKAAKAAGNLAKEGTRKAAQKTVDVHGEASKVYSAGKSASQEVKKQGGTASQARSAAGKGMFAAISQDLKDKIRSAGNNFLHGGSKSGGTGSGSGNGAQAHQRSGQNTSRDLGSEDSRKLNNTSNPSFKTATRFDPLTQSNVNMTRKEFFDEKREQGADIGKQIANDLMEMAEKKNQAQKKSSALEDSLTGNQRAVK